MAKEFAVLADLQRALKGSYDSSGVAADGDGNALEMLKQAIARVDLNYETLRGGYDSSAVSGDGGGNVVELLRYLRYVLNDSAFSQSVTEDLDGTVLERLEFIGNRIGAAFGYVPLLGFDITNASDATISTNTTLSGTYGIKRYRDLTINSNIVLTCETVFQIIVCRNLVFGNTSSRIQPGYNGANTNSSAYGGRGGNGDSATWSSGLPGSHPATFQFAAGGAGSGSSTGGSGVAASVSPVAALLAALAGWNLAGGNGGNSATGGGGSGGSAGLKGFAGGIGQSAQYGSGGGGSGIGGGGAGGGGGGPSGTYVLGGRGAGTVMVIVTGAVSGAAGVISADGEQGVNGTGTTSGGGGGGGGLAALFARTLTATPTLRANGGTGGTAGSYSAGGPGGAGVTLLVSG